jgi:hypothetical protein
VATPPPPGGRADEVGQVAEPDVERDVGDRPAVVGEQARRVPQPAPDEVPGRLDSIDPATGSTLGRSARET